MAGKNRRADHIGVARTRYESNRKRILATQSVCGICGKPVDKSLSWPHPMSACIDHIIPIDKGGHPFDINNLQLAHMTCNRAKSDKVSNMQTEEQGKQVLSNRKLFS